MMHLMLNYGTLLIKNKYMKSKIFKSLLIITIISSAFLFSSMINWAKIDNSNPITGLSTEEVYIKDVDSAFVISIGQRYQKFYDYYLTGNIESKTYKSGFMQTRTEYDTINIQLNKKMKCHKIEI